MKTKSFKFLLIFIILSLFTKTDYRLDTGIYCCKDDHDYYAHAETLAVDFDFDYSNQFLGKEFQRFNYKGKPAPSAFFGSGLLAAPFLFIGNLLDTFFKSSDLFNYKLIFYSFSSLFYLVFTAILWVKIAGLLNKNINSIIFYILLLGSGVGYYAFERYSMSHVYEVFTVTLVIFLSLKYLETSSNLYSLALPVSILLSIITRWVNLYVLIIPLIINRLIGMNNKKFRNDRLIIFSSIFSVGLFVLHTYLIYGVVTFNPEFVYNTSGTVENYISYTPSIWLFVSNNLANLFNLLFSFEFGLFWFAPIIFYGFVFSFKELFSSRNSKEMKYTYVLIILCFLQIFALVMIWRSAGSSYGFRYTFNLAPLGMLIYLIQNRVSNFENRYLLTFSIFSLFSVIFFETTKSTQLSLDYIENSFGKITKFAQPEYLTGYISSIIELQSYLKIFAQSIFGFLIFYIFLIFFNLDDFNNFMSNLSLPIYNEDIQILLNKVTIIEIHKFIILILLNLLLSYLIFKSTNKVKINE